MFGKKKPVDPSLDWTKTGSFVHKPSRGWLHSDDSLITGGVCYAVRVSLSFRDYFKRRGILYYLCFNVHLAVSQYVGCLQVLKSMRTLQYDLRQQVTRYEVFTELFRIS